MLFHCLFMFSNIVNLIVLYCQFFFNEICHFHYNYQTYNGPKTDEETCVHHPGVPIFHEGWGELINDAEKRLFHLIRWYFMSMHHFRMKYWSCCKRKTSDFNSFLSQEGCNKGSHQWRKDTVSWAAASHPSGQRDVI